MAKPRPPMTRSEMMSRIRSKDTKPEMLIRRGLHARGLRYRLHVAGLPGRPDMVLSRYRAVVFIHGCFWHAHQGCRYFRIPHTRAGFWMEKLNGNRRRDLAKAELLQQAGWRVLVVWECATKSNSMDSLLNSIVCWLQGSDPVGEISGFRARGNENTPDY